jgi:2-oxo-4-hydroxy-4-carboxy-5-ureidoimidazoline decarboxylase
MQLDTDDARLERFHALDDEAGRRALEACNASPVWVASIWAGRPYRTRAELLDAAETVCRDLDEHELELALAAHPRIGDRASGSGTEARWSRQEQASVSDADATTRDELVEANRTYEARFGQVFLIRAAGRSAAAMLAELRRRLGNDAVTERRELVDQLAQITRLRVERLLDS